MKKDRVLISAILFSAIWHIFWLSAFTVVVVPKIKKSVKFSSVSFLGPILEKSVLNVNVKAHERIIPENTYLASIGQQPIFAGEDPMRDDYTLPGLGLSLPDINDEEFTALTATRIDTDKIEPN